MGNNLHILFTSTKDVLAMRKYPGILRLAACAASINLTVPSLPLFAGEAPVATRQVGSDVILTKGTLQGQYITSAGIPVDGAQVIVRQANREVARTTTDAKGQFAVSQLKTGVYEVHTPSGIEQVRAWDAAVAPASSTRATTIISQPVVRGQGGGNTTLTYVGAGLGAIGATTGIIALADEDSGRRIASP